MESLDLSRLFRWRWLIAIWSLVCAIVWVVLLSTAQRFQDDLPLSISIFAATLGSIVVWASGTAIGMAFRIEASEKLDQFTSRLNVWSNELNKADRDRHLPQIDWVNSIDYDRLDEAVATANASIRLLDQRLVQLQAEQARTTLVLSGTLVGIVAVDHELKLLLINRAAKEMLDITGRTNSGRPILELIRQPRIIELLNDVRENRRMNEIEMDVVIGRMSRVLRFRASSLASEGSRPGVLVVISDETRLRRLEAMRRDFTANVSHELKTPLAAIRAYAETLLMGALEDPDANHRFVQQIADQAERLDNLIHDLLRLARLQSQPEGVRLVPVLLLPSLRQCVEQHRAIGKAKGIQVSFHMSDPELQVLAEEDAIHTILNNLIGNAVRYTEEGGDVSVLVESIGDEVQIVVADNGIGIPEEDHDRIFERFYRVEKARSSAAGGTGLGLAIVKNLVVAVGGTVRVDSRAGEGSKFTVTLKRFSPDVHLA